MGLQEHTTTLNSGGDPDHFRTACLGGLNHSASVTPMSRAEGSLQAKFGPWELYGRGTQHTPDVAMQQLDLCTQGSLLFQKSFTIFLHVYLCGCMCLCVEVRRNLLEVGPFLPSC